MAETVAIATGAEAPLTAAAEAPTIEAPTIPWTRNADAPTLTVPETIECAVDMSTCPQIASGDRILAAATLPFTTSPQRVVAPSSAPCQRSPRRRSTPRRCGRGANLA